MTGAADTAPQGSWWVKIRGASYGPYTLKQMKGFIAEGRVRGSTLVATNIEGPWADASSDEVLMPAHGAPRSLRPSEGDKAGPEIANMFVHAEINSSATVEFMAAISGLGLVVELGPGLWLLRTRNSVGAVRNRLSQTLHTGDRFVVVDASRDRLAWYNLGPETDVRIRDVWNGALPPAPAR